MIVCGEPSASWSPSCLPTSRAQWSSRPDETLKRPDAPRSDPRRL